MQLKAFIKKKAFEKHVSPQLVMQNYMLERLLERISVSKYKNNFIFKGGFLIGAIIGLDARTTMDLDATIKGITLSKESINYIFKEICKISCDDNVTFEILGINGIREDDDYPGVRVSLKATFSPINVPLTVDITTGDVITPREIKTSIPMLFEQGEINIFSYNIETILAEKIETILSRGITNTRPRDFYDVHILYVLRGSICNTHVLKNALYRTATKRGSQKVLDHYAAILKDIQYSEFLNKL